MYAEKGIRLRSGVITWTHSLLMEVASKLCSSMNDEIVILNVLRSMNSALCLGDHFR